MSTNQPITWAYCPGTIKPACQSCRRPEIEQSKDGSNRQNPPPFEHDCPSKLEKPE